MQLQQENRLQNWICSANVGYSPTPRQHFWKNCCTKKLSFACGWFLTAYLLIDYWIYRSWIGISRKIKFSPCIGTIFATWLPPVNCNRIWSQSDAFAASSKYRLLKPIVTSGPFTCAGMVSWILPIPVSQWTYNWLSENVQRIGALNLLLISSEHRSRQEIKSAVCKMTSVHSRWECCSDNCEIHLPAIERKQDSHWKRMQCGCELQSVRMVLLHHLSASKQLPAVSALVQQNDMVLLLQSFRYGWQADSRQWQRPAVHLPMVSKSSPVKTGLFSFSEVA